ncbi:unnamed protein product [Boreogadus saida]
MDSHNGFAERFTPCLGGADEPLLLFSTRVLYRGRRLKAVHFRRVLPCSSTAPLGLGPGQPPPKLDYIIGLRALAWRATDKEEKAEEG